MTSSAVVKSIYVLIRILLVRSTNIVLGIVIWSGISAATLGTGTTAAEVVAIKVGLLVPSASTE
jgi:hypothetical protein